MNRDLVDFEERFKQEADAYFKQNPGESDKVYPSHTKPCSPRKPGELRSNEYKAGHIVRLAVRKSRMGADIIFEHHSTSISKLEAQMEAEKAARKAGYPIIGHVKDVVRL